MTNPSTTTQSPAIDREATELYLHALDNRTKHFTFQTFDDDPKRKDPRLARVLHGTLDEHYETLAAYSRRGAGIFVCINATDFRGRKEENVTEVRCYFGDLDGAPVENLNRLKLSPHMLTTTSPGRYGAFYNIADAPRDAAHFKRTQKALAELFDSDPGVCDLPRVMRLPGCLHQKNPQAPFITEIDRSISQGETWTYTEAEFQQALAAALSAHRRNATSSAKPTQTVEILWVPDELRQFLPPVPSLSVPPGGLAHLNRPNRRRISEDSIAGLPKGPPDWSEGYKEGYRNTECARRAGSCLARGMSEDETLKECLRWDAECNDPPLGEIEVQATVASIVKTHTRNQASKTYAVSPTPLLHLGTGPWIFDGEVTIEPPKMLVRKVLPANGIAFIGGQSTAGKTFIAISLGVAIASGENFFGHKIKERVGVAYVAAEGQGVFALRLAAAKIAAGVKGPIPFAWRGNVPVLTTQEGLAAFISQLHDSDREMRERFGVRLGAVFIDTTKACFDMQDENSNAEVARVCNIIRSIGDSIGAVTIPLHHYGKDAGTGLRGASAWRDAADVVISVLAEIDQRTGDVSNRALAIAKARDGEQRALAPFLLEWVKLGVDDDAEDFGTCIVKLDPTRGLQSAVRDTRPKSIRAWDDACRIALREHGQDVQLHNNGLLIRAVELRQVKAKFCEIYVTGEGDPKKAVGAKDRAYRRVLDKMPADYVVEIGQDSREWLWLKVPSPR